MHRVGRTGRFGTHGIAVTLVQRAELAVLQQWLQDISGGTASPPGTPLHGNVSHSSSSKEHVRTVRAELCHLIMALHGALR
jgi:superfamily II DNA/RNA helicase